MHILLYVYAVYCKRMLSLINLSRCFFSKALCMPKHPQNPLTSTKIWQCFFGIQGPCSPATSFLGPQPLALASSPCSVPMVRCSMLGTAWLEWRVSWKETPERVRWFNERTLGWNPSLCGISCLLHLNSQSLAFSLFLCFCDRWFLWTKTRALYLTSYKSVLFAQSILSQIWTWEE